MKRGIIGVLIGVAVFSAPPPPPAPTSPYVITITPPTSLPAPSFLSPSAPTKLTEPTWDATRFSADFITQKLQEEVPLDPLPDTVLMGVEVPANYIAPSTKKVDFIRSQTAQVGNISVNGFYEMNFSQRQISPSNATGNLRQAIRNDPSYRRLPQDVLTGPLRRDIRYYIDVEGRFNRDLSIYFSVSQEPDFPMLTDIRLRYKNSELQFGQFDATFSNGAFLNLTRSLEGIKYTNFEPNKWSAIAVQGQERSKPKKVDFEGNGSRRYTLPNKNVLDDSVTVFVNNNKVYDYTINYSEGIIDFHSPKTNDQFIEVLYEFTNPIADLLPILNRKTLIGGEFHWNDKQAARYERVIKTKTIILHDPNNAEHLPKQFYQLDDYPVVVGSETLKLNRTKLRAPFDYYLDHLDGTVRLIGLDFFDSDTLEFSYDYYESDTISETVVGTNSRGPYFLQKGDIIAESVIIKSNDVLLRENYDYRLDYTSGKLYFNYLISETDKVSVTYKAIKTQLIEPTASDTNLKIGVTYLNEFVKPDEDDTFSRQTDTVSAGSLSVSGNIYRTLQSPFESSCTDDIIVTVGGVQLTNGTDYNIASTYRGEIELSSSVTVSGDVAITYDYIQDADGFVFLSGISGRTNQPYISGVDSGFELENIPVKYLSVDRIILTGTAGGQPLDELIIGEESYDVSYEEDGTQLSIRFKQRGVDDLNQSLESGLDHYPDNGTTMRIFYKYTLTNQANQGNIDQKTYGITVSVKPMENWTISGEFATAENNFSFNEVDAIETLAGQGIDNHIYKLTKNNGNPLVENSETIKILNPLNDRVLNRAADYYLNPDLGTIRFKSFTPSPSDNIEITFRYFDKSDTARAGQTNRDNTIKLGSAVSVGDVSISGHYLNVDKNFTPVGQIQEAKGTTLYSGRLDYIKTATQNAYLDVTNRSIFRAESQLEDEDVNLEKSQIATGVNWAFFDGLLYTKHNYDIETNTQKSATTEGLYDTDTQRSAYDGSIVFGPKYLRTEAHTRIAVSETDVKDKVAPEKTEVRVYDIGATYYPPKFWGIQSFWIKPFLSNSINETTTTATITSREVGIQRLDTYIKPRKNLTVSLETQWQTVRTTPKANKDSAVVFEEIIPDHLANVFYDPFSWMKTQAKYHHFGDESPVLGEEGRLQTIQSYDLTQLSVYPAIRSLNQAWLTRLFNRSSGSYIRAGKRLQDKTEQNKRLLYNSEIDQFSFHNFNGFNGYYLKFLSWTQSTAKTDNNVSSSELLSSQSDSDSFSFSGEMSYRPPLKYLNRFNYIYTFSESNTRIETLRNLRDTATSNVSTTRNIYTSKTPQYTSGHSLYFTPEKLSVYGLDIGQFNSSAKLSLSQTDESQESSNKSDTNTQSVSQLISQSDISHFDLVGKWTPRNWLELDGEYIMDNEFRRRNINTGQIGSVKFTDQSRVLSAVFHPYSKLSLTSDYEHNDLTQFTTPSLNTTDTSIETDFTERIDKAQDVFGIGAEWRLFNWFSLTGQGEILESRQSITTIATANVTQQRDTFEQTKTTAGFIFKPFKGFQLIGNWSNKQFLQNDIASPGGYGTHLALTYLPVQTTKYTIDMSMTRDENWGYGFNDIDRNTLKNGSNQYAAIALVERDDTVLRGEINVNINIPMRDVQYIERFTVVGSGFFSSIDDRRNSGQNSYDVSGFTIKARIEF